MSLTSQRGKFRRKKKKEMNVFLLAIAVYREQNWSQKIRDTFANEDFIISKHSFDGVLSKGTLIPETVRVLLIMKRPLL